ncbi:hypothetical protein JH26_17930 [Microvirga sp. BSC39]|nr:hypothetical protein JH26_17930 [Microvirga sp. BSC39]
MLVYFRLHSFEANKCLYYTFQILKSTKVLSLDIQCRTFMFATRMGKKHFRDTPSSLMTPAFLMITSTTILF